MGLPDLSRTWFRNLSHLCCDSGADISTTSPDCHYKWFVDFDQVFGWLYCASHLHCDIQVQNHHQHRIRHRCSSITTGNFSGISPPIHRRPYYGQRVDFDISTWCNAADHSSWSTRSTRSLLVFLEICLGDGCYPCLYRGFMLVYVLFIPPYTLSPLRTRHFNGS